MAQLLAAAKRLGIPPEDLAKRLIEEGLTLQREAEASSFAQIMRPVRAAAAEVDDAEIARLVETARADHHAGRRRDRKTR